MCTQAEALGLLGFVQNILYHEIQPVPKDHNTQPVAKSELYSLSPARSPGLRAGRSEALQQPLLVFQVLAHLLAHVEDGTVAAVEDGGQGAVCLAGSGKPITAGLRGSQPCISCHLAWEPALPACSLGKAQPHPGETKPRQTLPILQ